MKALPVLNWVAFALALTLSIGVASVPAFSAHAVATRLATPRSGIAAGSLPALVDHTRTPVSRRDYRRIVSGSTVADALLVELCEPDRIVAFAAYGARNAARNYRYAGKPTVGRLEDIEAVLALHPDLVVINGGGDRRPSARLRDAGVVIYDLGEMRGLATLIPNVHEVAELIGHPERGDRLARAIVDQMHAVANDVPMQARRSGLYLSAYGGNLFGGASGTSFHDVLGASGLFDAASAYHDWPAYSAEQVLAIDPDVIVTNVGMRPRICAHAGLATLRACNRTGGVIEIDDDVLGDPGLAMIDAAHEIRTAAYGPSTTL